MSAKVKSKLESKVIEFGVNDILWREGGEIETYRKYTKTVMKNIQPAKNKKIPHLKEQSMLRYLQTYYNLSQMSSRHLRQRDLIILKGTLLLEPIVKEP